MNRFTRTAGAALLFCCIAASSVAVRAQSGPGDAGVYTTHLRNGLQVIVIEDHAAPVVETAVWYRFGSLDETPGKTGLAHALEHMMFRGTDNISAGGLDDITERLGAEMNGETDYDYTQLYFVLPADKLDVGLYIEADRMQHALIRQSDWDIERGAVLSELDGDASSPFFDLLARVRAAAFPGQPKRSHLDWLPRRRRARDRGRHRALLSRVVCAQQRRARGRRRRRPYNRLQPKHNITLARFPNAPCRSITTFTRRRLTVRPSKLRSRSHLKFSIWRTRFPETPSRESRRLARSHR